jgi:hypothetical protein
MRVKIIAVLNKEALTSTLRSRSSVHGCGSPTPAARDQKSLIPTSERGKDQMVYFRWNDLSTDRSGSFESSLKGPGAGTLTLPP